MAHSRPYLTTQRLTRIPTSSLDQIRLFVERRLARRQFERQMALPRTPLDVVFDDLSHTPVTMLCTPQTSATFGNMPANELLTLCAACAHLNPQRIFEFGTYNGLTTLHLALNSAPDTEILTIDLAPNDPLRRVTTDDTFYTQQVQVGEYFQNRPEQCKIRQIWGNTLDFDTTPWRGQVDFIFIDAGHEYPLVKSDSLKALEMIRPGGVIFWHDYCFAHHGVYSWLNELVGQIKLANVPNMALAYHLHGVPTIRPRVPEFAHAITHTAEAQAPAR